MKEETISHEGIVTKITDDELEIKILAQSACAACHAKSACGMGEQAEKILTVPRPKDKEFTLMQKVNVKMAIGQGNKAAVGLSHPYHPAVGSLICLPRPRIERRAFRPHQHRRTDTLLYYTLSAS